MTLETPVWLQHGSYSAQADRTVLDNLFEAGVIDPQAAPASNPPPTSTGMQVAPNASSLAVDVAAGVCVINGTDQLRQGKYVCRNTAVVTVNIDPRPPAGQTRYDLVWAQVSDTAAGVTGGSDSWTLGKTNGTPTTGTPTLPALPSSALALAQVRVVSGSGTTFAPGDIGDLRVRARLRAPTQGWVPQRLYFPGQAASITGPNGLVVFTVGPYPCGWTANIRYHVVCGCNGGEFAFRLRSPALTGNILNEDRLSSAGNSTANGSIVWQEPDGAAVTFSAEGDRVTGANPGAVYAGGILHFVEALVILSP